MRVSGLNIYPIKSSRGVALQTTRVKREGLSDDRRWVIIDAASRFISQRSHPDLAKLHVTITAQGLDLHFGGDAITVATPEGPATALTVWNDDASGQLADGTVNAWLSDRLGQPLRLAFMGAGAERIHSHFQTKAPISTSYADAYPILIVTEASLQALNDYLGEDEPDLPMSRFRPNIVIDGAPAWDEDGWAKLRIGAVTMNIAKPCTRCIMTTLNPMTGESEGDAAMRAMTALRRSGDKRAKGVLFGWNAVPETLGEIAVGDPVDIIETRAPWPIQPVKR